MANGRKISLPSLFGRPAAATEGERRQIGASGEDIAAAFLKGIGYVILTRNYRKRFGEIDIIAEDDTTLVFVEVKTRSTTAFGNPLEAVDGRKQRRMVRAALAYLSSQGRHGQSARFDVIAVQLQAQGPPRIEHVRNAFDLTA